MPPKLNTDSIIGQKLNRWTVLRENGRQGRRRLFLCRCDCGTERDVRLDQLLRNGSHSCGCLQREVTSNRSRTHGMTHSAEYKIFNAMHARCEKSGYRAYQYYGGRGITVCSRWRKFEDFFADMGMRPSGKHSIDRKDNDSGYFCGKPDCMECGPIGREPNCKWATPLEQSRNRRDNRFITFGGKTMTVSDWARSLNVKINTLFARLHLGWSVEEALTVPFDSKPREAERLLKAFRATKRG